VTGLRKRLHERRIRRDLATAVALAEAMGYTMDDWQRWTLATVLRDEHAVLARGNISIHRTLVRQARRTGRWSR
jgi:hypothetical protein